MSMKKYQVFLRVIGTVSVDAEADSPEEAVEKVCDTIRDEQEPKSLSLDVQDIETFFPVAYNDESGDTKDVDVPNDLVEQEVRNALVGSKMWGLTRVCCVDGMMQEPSTSVFLTFGRAKSAMLEEFNRERDEVARKSQTYSYFYPDEDDTECYVDSDYGVRKMWHIGKIDINTGGSHVSA